MTVVTFYWFFEWGTMNKFIEARVTSILSPLCQTLLSERLLDHKSEISNIECDNELLIIRLDGVVIGYTTFDIIDGFDIRINKIYFRSIIKDHSLAEYWLSRQLKRHVRNQRYRNVLLAS